MVDHNNAACRLDALNGLRVVRVLGGGRVGGGDVVDAIERDRDARDDLRADLVRVSVRLRVGVRVRVGVRARVGVGCIFIGGMAEMRRFSGEG